MYGILFHDYHLHTTVLHATFNNVHDAESAMEKFIHDYHDKVHPNPIQSNSNSTEWFVRFDAYLPTKRTVCQRYTTVYSTTTPDLKPIFGLEIFLLNAWPVKKKNRIGLRKVGKRLLSKISP